LTRSPAGRWIEAHLSVVFAALAVSRWIQHETGWSIKRFVRAARRYREVTIQAGDHTLTAADPLPGDLSNVIRAIPGSVTHRVGDTSPVPVCRTAQARILRTVGPTQLVCRRHVETDPLTAATGSAFGWR
jgi:hypothetical protein